MCAPVSPFPVPVSISQSRCLSFQVIVTTAYSAYSMFGVSISQSRCLSFQVGPDDTHENLRTFVSISQSRCLSFQVSEGAGRVSPLSEVSISQSRCLSFQVVGYRGWQGGVPPCFNLAIEMLIISGTRRTTNPSHISEFQSRNRDAYHFRNTCLRWAWHPHSGFNLAIEMLIISG